MVGLRAPEAQHEALNLEADVVDVESDELAAPQGAGEPDEYERAIAHINATLTAGRDRGAQLVNEQGRLRLRRDAAFAADPGERRAHDPVVGRRIVTSGAMHDRDRSELAAQRRWASWEIRKKERDGGKRPSQA